MNTVAHESHHIGFTDAGKRYDERIQNAVSATRLPLWSPELLRSVGAEPLPKPQP